MGPEWASDDVGRQRPEGPPELRKSAAEPGGHAVGVDVRRYFLVTGLLARTRAPYRSHPVRARTPLERPGDGVSASFCSPFCALSPTAGSTTRSNGVPDQITMDGLGAVNPKAPGICKSPVYSVKKSAGARSPIEARGGPCGRAFPSETPLRMSPVFRQLAHSSRCGTHHSLVMDESCFQDTGLVPEDRAGFPQAFRAPVLTRVNEAITRI